ncbi:uncharacterized protein LOC121269645 isoform X2 [Carcharodon carcharias]|uniref:uncharacterized protein LOC121269645 isoform X2 n=1 Tax=Carcharodon carcharias TaxID=13397 RepID=UPI001B7E23EE|nr:uncharacterized protein LOC121269645 isoform X2 [Carcharodon carcharias]
MCENYFLITSFFLCFTADTEAAQTKNCSPIWRQVGETVTLPCKYSPRSDQKSYLDIEWAIRSTNSNESDKVILTHAGGKVYVTQGWQQRISFASGNGSEGDATLYFTSLAVNDSGIYNCKVKAEGKIHQSACNLTVRESVTPTIPVTQHKITSQKTTEQYNTTLRTLPEGSSKVVGIGLSIFGFIILLTFSIRCLQPKIHSSRTSANTLRKSEDSLSQGYQRCTTVQVPGEDIVYSAVQTARKDNVNSTAQAQDQNAIYSKVQKLNTVQNCDEIITYAPIQNLNATPQPNISINYNPDVVYAKLKNSNMASVCKEA